MAQAQQEVATIDLTLQPERMVPRRTLTIVPPDDRNIQANVALVERRQELTEDVYVIAVQVRIRRTKPRPTIVTLP